MSAAKHTTGPWEFVLAGSGNYPDWYVSLGNRGFLRLPATTDMDTMDADARLIAAAPDLLAALKLMLASHDATCKGEECQISGIDLARAAIAKAEGA